MGLLRVGSGLSRLPLDFQLGWFDRPDSAKNGRSFAAVSEQGNMQSHSNFAKKLLVAASMLTAQPAFAIDSSGKNANVELRALADQTARHLAQN